MPDCRWTAQEGFCDIALVILAVTVVIGLGSAAAELTSPIADPKRDRASVASTRIGARHLAMSPPSGRAHDEAAEMSTVASPVSRARSRAVSPDDLLSREVDDDDPRAFLAHMTAVMHRQGKPLPAYVGPLQSLVTIATPTATTTP